MPAFSTARVPISLYSTRNGSYSSRLRMTFGSRSLISLGSMSERAGMVRPPFFPSQYWCMRRARVDGTSSMPRYRSIPGRPLAAPALQQAQAQGVELDEARRVALVVGSLVLLERDVREAVEALRRFSADHGGVALVELHPDRALDMLLALVDQRLQHLALRREPEAVVDQLGIARHDLVLEMHRAAVEGDALDPAMGVVQDGAARRLVDAA